MTIRIQSTRAGTKVKAPASSWLSEQVGKSVYYARQELD